MFLRTLVLILALFTLTILPADADSFYEEIVSFGRGTPVNVFWHPDGGSFFVHTWANTLWHYDSETFETIAQIDDVTRAEISPNGRWLVTSGSEIGIALRTLDDVTQVTLGNLQRAQFNATGGRFLTHIAGDGYRILDGATLEPLLQQPALADRLDTILIWSLDGELLAEIAVDGTFKRWNVGTGELESTFVMPERERFDRWRWNPDNVRLLNSDADGNVRVWDTTSGHVLLEVAGQDTQESYIDSFHWVHIEWNPSGNLFVRCYMFGDSSRCDGHNMAGSIIATFSGGVGFPQFSPDGRFLATSYGVHDAHTLERIQEFGRSFGGDYFSWSADSNLLLQTYVISSTIGVYNLTIQSSQFALEGHIQTYQSAGSRARWSPDNQHILSWDASGLILLWSANSGQTVHQMTEHGNVGRKIAFSTNDLFIATTDIFGNIHIWDRQHLQNIHHLRTFESEADEIKWQPNGVLLASHLYHRYSSPLIPDNMRVVVWDASDGSLYADIFLSDPVRAIAWSPDGMFLALADKRKIYIWDTRLRSIIAAITPEEEEWGTNLEWNENGSILRMTFSRGTHGAMRMELWHAPDLRSLPDPIPFLNYGDYGRNRFRWRDGGTRIQMMSTTCQYQERYKGRNCAITVSTVFSLYHPIRTGEEWANVTRIERNELRFGFFREEPIFLWSPDGTKVIVSERGRSSLWRLDENNALFVANLEAGRIVSWSPDSRYALLGRRQNMALIVVDAQTGDSALRTQNLRFHDWHDDTLITRGIGDESWDDQQHWNIPSATLSAEYSFHINAFSQDMTYGAGSADGIFRLWRLR